MAERNQLRTEDLSLQLVQIEDGFLYHMVKAGLDAAHAIIDPNFVRESQRKAGGSIHNLVTNADLRSQDLILERLSFPQAFFLVEEKTEESDADKQVLTPENYASILDIELVFCVDPLDGTAQYARDLYEYSVSIGTMEHGVHQLGVIYAPEIKGGLLVFGRRGKGVYVALGNPRETRRACVASDKAIEESVIAYGIDIPRIAVFSRLLNKAASKSRTANSMGSCALGLALVASGRVDAFVQAPQMPWDWAAGYPLVEEAGGKVQLYEIVGGKINLLDKPEVRHYNPGHKTTGFIAGNPRLVEELTKWLVEDYGRSVE
ncbi:MAG: inositol monophosphatase [Candidatus Paceibacterota bacterium]|jgi:myo-inositol-1(or 4)-monophosphatase